MAWSAKISREAVRAYNREYRRKRYALLKNLRLCTECASNMVTEPGPRGGVTRCQRCVGVYREARHLREAIADYDRPPTE